MHWKDLSGSSKAALIFAVLGFVINLTSTTSSSVNGVTTCSHTDFAALALGALTLLVASVGLTRIRDLRPEALNLNIAVLVAADIIGIVHILRGIGIIGGPCA